MFFVAGFGGQRVLISPEHHVSISLFSDMDRPHPENKKIAQKNLEDIMHQVERVL